MVATPAEPDASVRRLAALFRSHPAWTRAAALLSEDACSNVRFRHRPGEIWHLARVAGVTRLEPGARPRCGSRAGLSAGRDRAPGGDPRRNRRLRGRAVRARRRARPGAARRAAHPRPVLTARAARLSAPARGRRSVACSRGARRTAWARSASCAAGSPGCARALGCRPARGCRRIPRPGRPPGRGARKERALKICSAERGGRARCRPVDTLAVPLGPGLPSAFLDALGERDDWRELTVFAALLTHPHRLFTRPGVRLLSGFFGPVERALRAGRPRRALRSGRLPALCQDRALARAARDGDQRGAGGGGRAREPLAARRRDGRGAASLRRRSRASAGGRSQPALSAHARAPARAPACARAERDRPARPRAIARRASCPTRRPTRCRTAIAEHALRFIPDARDAPDRDRRDSEPGGGAARRGTRRRLRRPLGDVHDRADAAAPGRQGEQPPQGDLRGLLGRDLRDGHARALRLARRSRRRALPAGRRGERSDHDRPQPADDLAQRRPRDRPPGPGGGRHDPRRAVLRDRRPRGLRRGRGARRGRPVAACACPRPRMVGGRRVSRIVRRWRRARS